MAGSDIEARLRAIEDRLEIYNVIAGHPPSADTGTADYVPRVWAEDGVFDPLASGRDAIAAVLETPAHAAAIQGGIAHFAGLPHVVVTGDSAVVTSYLQILVPQTQGDPVEVPNHGTGKGFRIHRASANRWELERGPKGWRIKRRTMRAVGTAEARALLKRAVAPA